ncbi:hypothetical protein MMC16_003153 [Acarospora aff. strigata]|nr:hypothetical protein [Acarospora aff. strigata]
MPSTKTMLMAAATIFSATVSAHMVMEFPKPYPNNNVIKNAPLDPSGSDFPCRVQAGGYDATGISNVMPIGTSQTLSFIGSAVHGGGSCQVSLTSDKEPNKSSKWQVIHSIIGGCPANVPGNLPGDANSHGASKFDFSIPEGIAPGDYTLAWTWFNKVGNREMYMQCAPVTVTGGSGKRDEIPEDREAFGVTKRATSFPDLFLANIALASGCATEEGKTVNFPNPGTSVVYAGNAADKDGDTMKGCGGGSTSGGSTSGGSSSGGSSSGAVASSSTPASSSAAAPSSKTTSTPTSAAPPTNTGGIFVPGAASASGVSPSAASSSMAAVVAPSSGTPTTSGGSGAGGALSGACTTAGMYNCVGGSSFQQCASGSWSIVQSMASGTKCTPGQQEQLNITAGKRSFRFTRGHIHRRHNSYLNSL